MSVISLREREYLAALHKIIFAERAGVSTCTIYELGNRVRRFPRFATVWKLSRAVGGNLVLELQRAKARAKA